MASRSILLNVLSPASFDPYLHDASGYRGEAAEVFLPATEDELRDALRHAAAARAPVTFAGAGTGLTGARVPHGGAVISLERFRTLEISPGRARCGSGALLVDLHREAARTRQFFGPNPTESSASIGGIVSTNAGSARSFKYGTVRRHVLSITATFADGSTRRFDRGEPVDFVYQPVRAPATTKNSAGYYLAPSLEWVDLLAGSEGTLAAVTEIELALLPQPAALLSGVIFFPSDDDALLALEMWRPIPELRLLEYMDAEALSLLRPTWSDIPAGARAALLIEQNLSSDEDPEVDGWSDRLTATHALADESWFGLRESEHTRFREFRHALPALVTDRARRHGFPKFGTDFAVPLPRHRELHDFYRARCGTVVPGRFTIFGHAGDANNHVNLLPETPAQAHDGELLIREFAQRVVAMGGTVAAEHGIGKTKTDLLALMYTPAEISAMRAVKQQLDPGWLLGQGTIFPLG